MSFQQDSETFFIFQDRRFQPLTHSSAFNSSLSCELAALAIEDRKDEAVTMEVTRAQSGLQELGAQIPAIKDADLTEHERFHRGLRTGRATRKGIRSETAEIQKRARLAPGIAVFDQEDPDHYRKVEGFSVQHAVHSLAVDLKTHRVYTPEQKEDAFTEWQR